MTRTRYAQQLVAFILLAAAIGVTAWWAGMGREVEIVAAPGGRVQCVSYAPSSRRDETLVDIGVVVEPARIEQDLKLLAERFDCVRTYSQSNGLAEVPRIAKQFGLKVLMGVWIGRDPVLNQREIESAARIAERDRDVITGIVVGNEVLLRGEQTPAALAGYLDSVKAATGLPVTYADVWEFWRRHRAAIETHVDFITFHVLPYWEDDPVPVDTAIAHLRDIHALMQADFPGRELLIGETGWPSAGRQRHGATPSLVNQARFVREFLAFTSEAGIRYNVIEAFDQPWKRRQEGAVGGYWGLYDNQRGVKFSLVDPVVEEPRWPLALAAGLVLALAFVAGAVLGGMRFAVLPAGIMGLAGYVTGCVLASQVKTLWLASRSTTEWTIAIAWTVLAMGTSWWLARAIASRRYEDKGTISGWSLLRFVWLFGATIVSLLLVLDSRYRDFPIALFITPVAALSLVLLATRERLRLEIEERIMGTWLVVAALLTPLIEGFENGHALLWALLCLGFGLSVLLPGRSARHA